MPIASRHNEQIKRLRRLSLRKYRDRARLFLAEGPRLVAEAAAVGPEIVTLIVAPDLLTDEGRRAMRLALTRDSPQVLEVTPEVMETVSPRHGSDGLAAVVRQRWERLADIDPYAASCWVAVKEIGQPWSIGTILRVCSAVGGGGAVLIGDSTDPYDALAVRASLGAVFSQRLAKASFSEFASWKQRHGCLVIGTSPCAPADYREVAYRPPAVVFMGSERIGLTPQEQALCDTMISIPMLGRCESHHVAVATGIVLYEVLNQTRVSGGQGR